MAQIIVTACYGETHWRAARGWVDHLRALTALPIEFVSLDDGEYKAEGVTTWQAPDALPKLADMVRVRDKARLQRIVGRLENGATCVQIDMDVLLKLDPQPMIDLPYDFIISRSFGMPKRVVEKLGFAGCTGFFVARPGALPFLRNVLAALETRGTNDQSVINDMLAEADWRPKRVAIGPFAGRANCCAAGPVQVCVLPKKSIMRNDNLALSWFGNHWATLLGSPQNPTPTRGRARVRLSS